MEGGEEQMRSSRMALQNRDVMRAVMQVWVVMGEG